MNILSKIQNFIINLTKEPETNLQKILREANIDAEIKNDTSYIRFYDKKKPEEFGEWRRGDLHVGNDIIENVVDFIICRIDKEKTLEDLIDNETKVKQGYIDFKVLDLTNVYTVAIQHNHWQDRDFTLFIFKENKLICKVPNVKYHHSKCKFNKQAELLCEQYYTGYNSARTIKINELGQISDLSKNQYTSEHLTVDSMSNTIIPFSDFTFEDEQYIYVYFYKKECPSFHIAYYYCKKYADELTVLQNKFDDDVSTVNYCAKFDKSKIEDICFIHFCLDKRWNNSAYAAGLYGTMKSKTCAGSAVYNLPIADYCKGLEGQFLAFNEMLQVNMTTAQKENFKEIIKEIYDKYNEEVNYESLPENFTDGLVFEDVFLDKLGKYVRTHNGIIEDVFNPRNSYNRELEKELRENLKVKYNEIQQLLTLDGTINRKWTSELELFRVTYSIYNDAIYQYHATWLGQQSLDIFIPSLNIGIEYQGKQHYEPVEIFGGMKGFDKTLERDILKRSLCQNNHIKLIEWKYDEMISKVRLEKKINEILGK